MTTMLGCTTCASGKTLSSDYKKCVTPVTNCKTHNSSGNCTECENGSYLAGTTTCTSVDLDNCAQTYTTSNNATCKTCEGRYFDDGNGACITQHNQVSNCEDYNNANDTYQCDQCADGFVTYQ